MQLTLEQMEIIKAHGGRATRLQLNLIGGTSRRNVVVHKKDGRNVWFPDDDTTPIEIEDGDKIELVPSATSADLAWPQGNSTIRT